MTDDQPPPTPLPPAAQAPYPPHPAPHPHPAEIPVAKKAETGQPAIGALGLGLIGGALAAAVGIAVALPLFRKRSTPATPQRRRPATRRAAPRRQRKSTKSDS